MGIKNRQAMVRECWEWRKIVAEAKCFRRRRRKRRR
jgi:hypothetical protein